MFENYFELDTSTLHDTFEKYFEIFQDCNRCRNLEEKLEDVNEELDRMKDIVHDRSRYHSPYFYIFTRYHLPYFYIFTRYHSPYLTLQRLLKSCSVFYQREHKH